MVFKQSLKGLKNKKIIFIKMILKLESFFPSEYIKILFHLILYSWSHFDLKKVVHIKTFCYLSNVSSFMNQGRSRFLE